MRRITVLLIIFLLSVIPVSMSMAAPADPGIAPIQSKPHGLSYSEWAAKWWQWALETPASVHPLLEIGNCNVGQSGKVWFLGGTFANSPGIERDCTVPASTALFFPIINAVYLAFQEDPPETKTKEFLQEQVACGDYILKAEIDGVAVKNPTRYLEQSTIFDVNLPEDNIFGIESQLLGPSADQGIYLFVQPLSVGTHTIHFKGSQTCPFGEFDEEATYKITVTPANKINKIPSMPLR